MIAVINHSSGQFEVDLSKPIDISIPLKNDSKLNAFHAPPFEAKPFTQGDFTGSVEAGAPVNFFDIELNPHGNGTHTECVGHISKEKYTINQCLRSFFFLAEVISIFPERTEDGDQIITQEQMEYALNGKQPEAVVIRTLPNDILKLKKNYSGTNPPYLQFDAAYFLQKIGVKHLLIDLPSVDREEDGGKLLAHKMFWQYPNKTREDATITELIYVPEQVLDGSYLLNIQIASFEIDVSPSKPVLYEILK